MASISLDVVERQECGAGIDQRRASGVGQSSADESDQM
jgi:hypothetical protein